MIMMLETSKFNFSSQLSSSINTIVIIIQVHDINFVNVGWQCGSKMAASILTPWNDKISKVVST